MTSYLMIETRDPFDSNDVPRLYELARNLVANGSDVTLFLAQNGVLPVRGSDRSEELKALAIEGVEVYADEFSLLERGISPDSMSPEINPAHLNTVIDLMAKGTKLIWH